MSSNSHKHFRPSLLTVADQLTSYSSREPAACDLSLISGPFIWEKEVSKALASASGTLVGRYPLPNQNPQLLELLSEHDQLQPGWVRLAPGADVALEVVVRQILGAGDHMAVLCPNFPRFEMAAKTIEGVTTSNHLAIDELPEHAKLRWQHFTGQLTTKLFSTFHNLLATNTHYWNETFYGYKKFQCNQIRQP